MLPEGLRSEKGMKGTGVVYFADRVLEFRLQSV